MLQMNARKLVRLINECFAYFFLVCWFYNSVASLYGPTGGTAKHLLSRGFRQISSAISGSFQSPL